MNTYNPMIIGCTGHRDLGNMTMEKLDSFMDIHYPDKSNLHLISGGAVGFDLLFAWWAYSHQIPYSLYLAFPFETHTAMWNASDRAKLESLCLNAAYVTHESVEYTPKVYFKRDEKVVDNSHEIVSYWSGIKKGGTYYTVKYATKKKKTVRNCFE